MGIDYGTKRVGIALTDDAGLMAFPHKVIENSNDLVSHIVKIVEDEAVGEIVIGHSLGRSGEPNPVHSEVEELMTDLTLEIPVPIHLEPEQYSTQEAIRFQGRNSETDASAAAIILNSYLSRNK